MAPGPVGQRAVGLEPPQPEQGPVPEQGTQQQVEAFKKSFSACLEAKDYVVKI